MSDDGELGTITRIEARKNYILRKAASHSRNVHILCANVDQAILLYTLTKPHTTSGFANRFLVVAEAYHIPIQIVINKVDLLDTEELLIRKEDVKQMYEAIGYPVTEVSALDVQHQETVRNLLQDKVSFISGHSGAGKSTLINLVDPALDLKTGEISMASEKGRHTTTYAEMHPLSIGGYIIDSPGIKEMGIAGLEKAELAHYFPEMQARMDQCRFHNCIHVSEPDCAVKAAVESGEIHHLRYNSYLSMLEDLD
jgi:ribosome biogenesis GTPase